MDSLLTPLPGAIVRDFKRCGHPACKCAQGELHGPYFVRRWYEGKKQRKQYVRPEHLATVRASIKLFDLERRVAKVRTQLTRRLSPKSRRWNLDFLAQLEGEAQALHARYGSEVPAKE